MLPLARGCGVGGLVFLHCSSGLAAAGLGLGLTATSFLLDAGVSGSLGLLFSKSDSTPSSSDIRFFFFLDDLEAGAEIGELADWRAMGWRPSVIRLPGSPDAACLLFQATCTSNSAAKAETIPVAPATSKR